MPRLRTAIRDWSRDRAPWLHRFLVSQRRPVQVTRTVLYDVAVVVAILGLLLGGLLLGTGQPIGEPPVVVIESGSMMHCAGGVGLEGDACQQHTWGRLGTIDAGDLIFVRDVDGRSDVQTHAAGGETRYGKPGDVLVFRKDGSPDATPIIHRAMFWLQVHGDGTYSVPELGIHRVRNLNDPRLVGPTYELPRNYHETLAGHGPEASGFVTRGDNNEDADQGSSISRLPVRPEWVIGKARGELPWIGMVKLWLRDLASGALTDGMPESGDYERAPADLRAAMWWVVAAAVVMPWLVDRGIERFRTHDDEPLDPED